VTRDILEVGDVRAHDLSALELQNAESKRVYETGGARRQEFTTEGTTHKKATGDGEHRLIVTKGYGSTAATSVLSKMLATQQLRAGDGAYSMPSTRRAERLFGVRGSGRSRLIKMEFVDDVGSKYRPEEDTVVDAYMRMLSARVAQEAAKRPPSVS
jgi:hypothetical protein